MASTDLVHRYNCTIHDGDDCDGHCTVTPSLLLSWYAVEVAFVAGAAPATTLDAFADQLSLASCRMDDAGVDDAEDLEVPAIYIADAAEANGDEQAALLKRASRLLVGLTEMVDEYRRLV
jgi:hypothetical protein